MRIIHTSAALLAVAALASAALAEEFTIKSKYEQDRSAYYEIEERTTQTIAGAQLPQPIVIESGSLFGFTQETLEASDGQARLKLTFDRRAMNFKHPMMGEMEFDSDSGEKPSDDNSMSLIAAPFVGKSLTVTVKDNEVVKVEDFDKLQAAIEDSAMGDLFYEQSRDMINPQSMTNELIASRLQLYPDKPVAVGDTWQNTHEMEDPFLGKLVTTYDCKLDKVETAGDAQLAHIAFRAQTKLAPGETPQPNSMGMTPGLKNLSTEGTAVIDIAQGRVQRGTSHTTGSIELSAPAGDAGQPAPAMDIAIDSRGTTRLLTAEQRAEQKTKNKADWAARKAAKQSAEPDAPGGETPTETPE